MNETKIFKKRLEKEAFHSLKFVCSGEDASKSGGSGLLLDLKPQGRYLTLLSAELLICKTGKEVQSTPRNV